MNRLDLLKTVHFDHPESIPVIFHINPSCWDHYPRAELRSLVEAHPYLFPEGAPPWSEEDIAVPYAPWCRKGEPWTDPWGCIWETSISGYVGAVTGHPLTLGDSLEDFRIPDYRKTTHWYPVEWIRGQPPKGGSVGFFDCLNSGEIGHGHTFLKLIDILGFENALLELYDGTEVAISLLERIEEFNLGLVRQFVDVSRVEWLGYAEDLGMQVGPMISPDLFQKYILPSYRRIMALAHEADVIIHMHSDGDIKALWNDLSELPITVLNIQDQANGVDWISQNVAGRVAVDLDIDRMSLSIEGSLYDIRDHFDSIRRRILRPEGGLILTYGLYPGVPLENAALLMDQMESIATEKRR